MIDLLDARGYEVKIVADADVPLMLEFLGSAGKVQESQTHDDDAYTVAWVKHTEFSGEFAAVIKDGEISKSGLLLRLTYPKRKKNLPETVCVTLSAAGEEVGKMTLEQGETAEQIFNVYGLCAEEKEYVSKCHSALYAMLEEVDRVCVKNDINYFLVFGGLLGSVRHGEIIPWDDDLDIAMTRKDFEKFRRSACHDLKKGFKYLDPSKIGKHAFLDFMARVVYTEKKVPVNTFRKVEGRCNPKFHEHISLDIFILDEASESSFKHKIHMFFVRGVYGLGMGHRSYIDWSDYKGRGWFTNLSVRYLAGVGKLVPTKLIFRMHDRICRTYEGKGGKDYFMSNGYLPFIHTRYSKEWFDDYSVVRLGPLDVRAPKDVHAYLKRAYYEYYQIRPLSSRIGEHSAACKGIR